MWNVLHPVGKRPVWAHEELVLMAHHEATLERTGVSWINKALEALMPGRTLESIKGQQRTQAYRDLVPDPPGGDSL